MKVAILGTGLIGGSIGLALRRVRVTKRIAGYDTRRDRVERALRLNTIDEACGTLVDAVRAVDVVVVAVPVAAAVEVVREALAHTSGAIVTDATSVKGPIVEQIDHPRFVGAHPLAGSEHSGPEHARQDLFDSAACAITPTEKTDSVALAIAERFWRWLGTRPIRMSASEHDRAVAVTSHVPHLCAFAMALLYRRTRQAAPVTRLVGPSLRDGTRVAASDPELWREILLMNREVPEALDALLEELGLLRERIVQRDEAGLERLLMEARATRESYE